MVTLDIFMTDTAKMSDVVLPGTTFLERLELKDYLGQGAALATLGNQAIEPVGNALHRRRVRPDRRHRDRIRSVLPLR